MSNTLLTYITNHKKDAVLFKAEHLMTQAGEDPFKQDSAFDGISEMLLCLQSDILIERYTTIICKTLKIKPATLSKAVKLKANIKTEQVVDEGQKALPSWINKDRYYNLMFDWRIDLQHKENTGIYFASSNNEARQLTNFVIKPLVHVWSDDLDNRRLTEVDNGYTKSIIQLPSKAWSSVDMFESTLMDQGVFYTKDGFTKSHLNKLKAALLPMYPTCYELKTLGWQPEGFFAFSNLIFYKEEVINFDEYGVAKVGETNFLSMGASRALAEIRAEDDLYKNDKYLKHVVSELNFAGWSSLMVQVYGDNGMMGVCWALLAAFKDIVFKRNNNCPVPYAYGPVGSGKSKLAESVANLFTHEMPAFNLNQGTDYAFFERMERFRNVPVVFNEFDENAIKEEWFRAIKGAFDGEGRNKGSGRKNKTKTQDINCLPILIGQYMSTKDDGSVLTRSIPVKVVEKTDRTEEEIKHYDELKQQEKAGLSSIVCEVLAHRRYVMDNYPRAFDEAGRELKQKLAEEEVAGKSRIIENYTNSLALIKMFCERFPSLGFSYKRFFDFCQEAVIGLSHTISESNALSEFWKTLEFLLNQDMIEAGWHYKIEVVSSVRVSVDRKTNKEHTFAEPTKLIYLRLNTVHALYQKEKKIITGKPGLNEQTILTYFKDQDYFIGNNPASTFKKRGGEGTNTSSFVFEYDKLGINLERFTESADPREVVELKGWVFKDAIEQQIVGHTKLFFQIWEEPSPGQKVWTYCYYNRLEKISEIKSGSIVKIKGALSISTNLKGEFRRLEVETIDFISQNEMEFDNKEVKPAF